MIAHTSTDNFIFWVHPWKSRLHLFRTIDKEKLTKCVINHHGIKTDAPISQGKLPLNISLESIDHLDVGPLHDETNLFVVRIETKERNQFLFVPTNPFEPTLTFLFNAEESYAMFSILTALKQGESPGYDTNPYIRQLKKKPKPAYVLDVQEEWDEHISPWVYFKQYGKEINQNRIRIEIFVFTMTVLFVFVGVYLLWHYIAR